MTRHDPDLGPPAGGSDAPEDEAVARLLELSGPRPEVPEHLLKRIRASARRDWQAKVEATARARRKLRLAWTLAAAASLLLALGLVLRLGLAGGPPASSREVAVVTAVSPAGGAIADRLAPGTGLTAGTRIATGQGEHLALLLDGVTARLDQRSELVLASGRRLELAAGAVYVDSGEARDGIEVATPHGVVRDIGTRFAVRLEGAALEVQVRQGEVELETRRASHRASAGTALSLRGGSVDRREVPPYGAAWEWVLEAAPPFELEGSTLREFLERVAAETGWEIRFSDPALARRSASIVTHGSLAGVRLDEAVALVLPSAGLGYRIENGVLWVEP